MSVRNAFFVSLALLSGLVFSGVGLYSVNADSETVVDGYAVVIPQK